MAKVFDNIKKLPSQLGHQFQKLHKPVKDNEKRVNQRKELFQYKQCAQLGFPAKPSAITYDPSLKLLAIGTKEGALHVFGAPGVEYSAEHTPKNVQVRKVVFIPNQGRLLTLTSDWVLHHWEINGNVLGEVRSLALSKSEEPAVVATSEEDTAPKEQESREFGFGGWTLTSSGERLFVGSESGALHIVSVNHDSLQLEEVLTSDQITNLAPLDQRSLLRLGAIVQISQSPTHADRILLGFERGTALIYNSAEKGIEAILSSTQSLTDVTWFRDGERVKSSHQDGSYVVWSVAPSEIHDLTAKPSEPATTPYGPFPCKAITKLFWKTAKLGNMVIFGGGMPRASYGDKYTVSVIREDDHVCFDFTSKVVDFELVCGSDEKTNLDVDADETKNDAYDEPHTLFVLCEEELVAIDLYTPGWPLLQLPYLQTLHCSAITALCHVAEASATLVSSLREAGSNSSCQSSWSKRDWPVTGGRVIKSETASLPEESKEATSEAPEVVTAELDVASKEEAATTPVSNAAVSSTNDVILTGHEDGSVVFWAFETGCISRLCTLKTNSIFGGQVEADTQQVDDDWPPFRKTGQFDPFVDDPRIAVTLIKLVNETLLVGGAGGQFSVWNISGAAKEIEVDVMKISADLIEKESEYVCHTPIALREGNVHFDAGWQPTCVVQVLPAAPVSAAAIAAQWQLLAVGTAHGLAIIDTRDNRLVNTHFTGPTSHTTADVEPADSRGKQIRKSLRQSFRKLRKLGGGAGSESSAEKRDKKATLEREKKATLEREKKVEAASEDPATKEGEVKAPTEEATATESGSAGAAADAAAPTAPTDEVPAAPEEATAATEEDKEATATVATAEPYELDSHSGVVRCLRFASACLTGLSGGATLWAGTNAGVAYGFHLTVNTDPAEHRRAELSKEVRLVHRAPVIDLFILARGGAAPCLSLDEVGQELLLVSEEQVKLFSLPSLKPRHKNKVSAVDGGSRIRSAGLARFTSSLDASYSEYDLLLANSLGQLVLISLPKLVRQTSEFFGATIGSDNNHLLEMANIKLAGGFAAFRPCGLTTLGHNQLRLFVLGTRADHLHPHSCTLDLAEGMRPVAVAAELDAAKPFETEAKAEASAPTEETVSAETNEQSSESAAAVASAEDNKVAEDNANASINQAQLLPMIIDGEKHQGDITMDNITEYVTSAEKEAEKQQLKSDEVEVHTVEINNAPLATEDSKAEEINLGSPHDTELTLEAKYAKEAASSVADEDGSAIRVGEH